MEEILKKLKTMKYTATIVSGYLPPNTEMIAKEGLEKIIKECDFIAKKLSENEQAKTQSEV